MCNWNKPKASSISPSSISSKVMEFLEGIKNEVEVINEELEEKDKINRTNIERDVEEKMEDSKKELSEGNVEITIEDLKNFTIKNYIKLLKQDHDSLIEHRRKGEDIDNTLRAVRSHYLILIKKITQLAILEYRLKT
ncbi:MAG: hypothetical protein LBR09_00295 [Endomicrobium sp.]|jgi:hypothetical protein|nr:hypothetical protein [Endomicrobium sp.]